MEKYWEISNKKRNSIRSLSLENDDRTVDFDELLGEKMSKTLDIVGFSEIHRIIVSKHWFVNLRR